MINDANSIDSGTVLDCEICIVGAGAAGITIALQFLHSNLRVILLESGSTTSDPATQQLYSAEIADSRLHSPGDRYRARRFGGSTTIWGGRCVPFDPLDFTHRPWITEDCWPIEYSDVLRYYPDANNLCEAGEFVYDAARASPGGMRPVIRGFDPDHFSADRIERFSCPTDFGVRYQHRLTASTSVQVLLNANCTSLHTGPDGMAVERLTVRTLAGVAFLVHAKQVILAAGGLEIPRLLLASGQGNGLGNDSGQVGRNYMCHIAGTVGTLRLDVPREDVWHNYEVADDGTYCRRRLALKWEAQQNLGLASAVLRLHFPPIPDPAHRTGALSALYLAKRLIPYEYAKRLTSADTASIGTWLRHVVNVAADAPCTVAFLLHWLRKRTFAIRKFPSVVVRPRANRFTLDYHAEQQPNSESRVTLGQQMDQLGLPKLRIDWRYSALDVRTAGETLRLLNEDLAKWGHGQLYYDQDRIEEQITRDGAYGGHHIGTARMGHHPATSVVDRNCRVHGIRNLYIAGSAVFPTSSQANPTLTIVALALRLADHIRRITDDKIESRRVLLGVTSPAKALDLQS
jgi:choline dehydrogenase-like flavoprotein